MIGLASALKTMKSSSDEAELLKIQVNLSPGRRKVSDLRTLIIVVTIIIISRRLFSICVLQKLHTHIQNFWDFFSPKKKI